MANVDITIRTVDQTRAGTRNVVGSLTEINSAIQIMRQGLEAAKRAYEFGKEGAQLDLLKTRFDRLSESIGTTSDALMTDLKEATRGMYSDFELVESVTNLVGLGLAKDHDEAVRLSRVAAGLNMNMNQLVLTLTNMTTMRFDALGVSTDGFKDKLKDLESQGYDTNDAFKEAFLQQAEMQLEKVGEAADSQAGAFMRLEAHLKNIRDEAQKTAADGLTPLVESISDGFDETSQYNEIMERTGWTTAEFYERARDAGMTVVEFTEHLSKNADVFSEQKAAMQESTFVLEEMGQVTDEASKANQEYLDSLGRISDEFASYQEKLQEVTENEKLSIEERQAKINEYTADYEMNAQRRIIAGVEEQLAQDGLTEQEKQAIEELMIQRGLATQEAVNQMRQEREEIAALIADINSIPSEKNVTISIQQLGGYDIGTNEYNRIAYAGRASGGPVGAGQGYIVGEQGPELFVPSQNGNIVPNGSGIDEERLGRVIANAIMKVMQ